MIFVILFDRCFVGFMFNFASWPGRPDKRRTHTEHTQSTHRAHAEPWRGNRTGKSRSSSTFLKQSFNFLRASRSIAKTGSCWALFWSFFRGRKKCRKSCSKGCPKGPQKSTKIDKKRALEGSRKGTSKWDPLQDQEKWDFAIIYYTLARSEVWEKVTFWDHFGDHMGDKIVEIGVQRSSKKSSENRHHILVILGSIVGTLGLLWGTLWSVVRELFSGLVPGGLPRWILDTV